MAKLLIVLFAAVLAAVRAGDDQYLDWECPGMPCFIVNYFYNSSDPLLEPYTDIKQTCAPVYDFQSCLYLHDAVPWDAVNTDGSIAGTHDVDRGHHCEDLNFQCLQKSCMQNTLSQCNSYCDDLDLLHIYNHTCYEYCGVACAGK